MKERPIIMQAESVRGILDGRKTQTRMIVKLPAVDMLTGCEVAGCELRSVFDQGDIRCPYGIPCDRLWVKETFFVGDGMSYRADEEMPRSARAMGCRWNPSLCMPRLASRITLEITDVRVQRVQEISEEDAVAEGVRSSTGSGLIDGVTVYHMTTNSGYSQFAAHAYHDLWDSINAKRGFPWASNPWVWAITFKMI